jgi:endonuclease YncB( thermonuclease family)
MSGATFGPYQGVIDSVHDGDTVYVKLDAGFDLTIYARVRVIGINAPELSTPAGKAARDFAQTLLAPGMAVKVLSFGWDKFGGRVDASIQYNLAADPQDFATVMMAAGHAVAWDGKGPKPV